MIAEGYFGYEYKERNYIQKETEFTPQQDFIALQNQKIEKIMEPLK